MTAMGRKQKASSLLGRRLPRRAQVYARSMRAQALWLWIDSKFSTSTA